MSSIQLTWQVAVPREALAHDFLMHALLAIAAAQLIYTRPAQRHLYEKEATTHRNLALQLSIAHLNNITEDNCHALFALSSIVAILAFAFPHSSAASSPLAPLDGMVEFIMLVRGVGTVLTSAAKWIDHGRMSPLLRYNWSPKTRPISPDVETAFDRLVGLIERTVHARSSLAIYVGATYILKKAFETYELIEDERIMVFIWPCVVPESYIAELKKGEPMALVILAHYAVLIYSVNDQWSSGRRGSQLVEAIWQILPWEWKPAVHWPLQAVHKEIQCISQTRRTPANGGNSLRTERSPGAPVFGPYVKQGLGKGTMESVLTWLD
ncbi:hypothetical protein MMC28_011012 [Mycoblastus sanguinarius]|nr:hypothetical protein [Mycoblastus sanguinarius]